MPLLGNIVISKNFLRTRKIMVMHSKERGAAPPPLSFLSPSSFPLPNPIPTRKRGGILLPVGVGLLLARPPPGRPHLPLFLYIRGVGGTPRHTS